MDRGWIDASWPLLHNLTVSSDSECDLRDEEREESENDCSNSEWERKGTGRQTYDLLNSETSCPRVRTRNCLLKSEEDDPLARESPETIQLDDDTDYSVRHSDVYLLYSDNESTGRLRFYHRFYHR